MAWILIISGAPCAGKTLVAEILGRQLHLPTFHKDQLKELLFDQLHPEETQSKEAATARSSELSVASTHLLLHILRQHVVAGQGCILESNFRPIPILPFVAQLQGEFPGSFQILQIHCKATPETLKERIIGRISQSQWRHRVHDDAALLGKVEALAAEFPCLDFTHAELITVDTNNKKGDKEGFAQHLLETVKAKMNELTKEM